MNKKLIATLGLGSLLVASVAGAQMLRGNYDEPAYEAVVREKPFEIRRYDERLVAETTVQASSLRSATSAGFSRLADYIFGGNTGTDGESQKIAMTTPVESAPADEGEYTVVFTMPPNYTLDELPKPNDPRVRVRRDAPRLVATTRFSGVARNKDLSQLSEELLDFVERQGYVAESAVRIAQYDPPWIPGPFRRNELMVEVSPR